MKKFENMLTLIEIVSTFEKDCFKRFSFLTKLVRKNIESIDDFVDEILLQMQNSLIWSYDMTIQNMIILMFIDLIVSDDVIFNQFFEIRKFFAYDIIVNNDQTCWSDFLWCIHKFHRKLSRFTTTFRST